MMEQFEYDADREAYVMTLQDADEKHRISVPLEFVQDEIGDAATEADRLAWINANMAQILETRTARKSGGIVKAPWGRVLVEEIA